MWPPPVPKLSDVASSLPGVDAQIRGHEEARDSKKDGFRVAALPAKKTQRQPLSEKSESQFVLLIAKSRGDFLKKHFVPAVIFDIAVDPRSFALEAELCGSGEDAAEPFLRQVLQRRVATARPRQGHIRGKRVRQDGGIDSDLRDVAVRFCAGEKGPVALMDEDMQDGVIESGVDRKSTRLNSSH